MVLGEKKPNDASTSRVVRAQAVGRKGPWGTYFEAQRGPSLSLLPHSCRFLQPNLIFKDLCH